MRAAAEERFTTFSSHINEKRSNSLEIQSADRTSFPAFPNGRFSAQRTVSLSSNKPK
jgi:hypothetical protein